MGVWKVAAVGVGAVGVLLGTIFWFQEKLLYHPHIPGVPTRTDKNRPPQYRTPGGFGLAYREAMVRATDGTRVHTWLVMPGDGGAGKAGPDANAAAAGTAAATPTPLPSLGGAGVPGALRRLPTLLFFHGNAGNMGWRLPFVRALVLSLGCNVLMVEYRGFGMSEGYPEEKGLGLDATAALKYALRQPEVDPSSVFVYGRSLGGAVAIQLAERHPTEVAGAIVENTFLSIDAMVDHLFPLLTPFKWFLRMHFPTEERVKRLTQPLFLVSGLEDEMVPPFHMRRLRRLATRSSDVRFAPIVGGTHDDTWEVGGPLLMERLRLFINREPEPLPSMGAARAKGTDASAGDDVSDEARKGAGGRPGGHSGSSL